MANTLNLGTGGNWAAKEGSLLAYNDENGNFKPLPFDFTRASSATRVNSEGLVEVVGSNQPRVDYSSGEGALLLEPSRTNQLINSDNFDIGASWQRINCAALANQTISPSGDVSADLIQENTVNGSHDIRQGATVTSGVAYTYSIFVKRYESGSARNISFFVGGTSGTGTFNFDTESWQQASGLDSFGVDKFDNGWYRIYFTDTTVSTAFNTIIIFNNLTTTVYQGDGVSGLYLYGAQLEQGPCATSYIPTQGAAVTRVGEDCKRTLPDNIIGQTEGTIYAEFNYLNSVGERRWIYQAGDNNNQVYARIESNQTVTCQIISNSTAYLTVQNLNTNAGVNKIAISYASNDAVIYINGSQVSSITSLVVPAVNQVSVGVNIVQGQHLSGNINDFKTYNTRLSNKELAALTTL